MDIRSIIDSQVVSDIVFYPESRKIPENLEPWIKVLKFDVEENITLGGYMYEKEKDVPTILLFHGNGELAEHYKSIAPMYFDCNVNLAVIDFRGYGFSTGKPYFSSLLKDALPVYQKFEEWISKNKFLQSFFIMGRSLGSACAAEIGSHNPTHVKGIIFESGFASVYNMMTGLFRVSSPNLTPGSLIKYSNETRVRKFKKPTLIIHGTADFIVPFKEGQILFNNLPEISKKFIPIQGAGHNNILMFQDLYFNSVREFVSNYK